MQQCLSIEYIAEEKTEPIKYSQERQHEGSIENNEWKIISYFAIQYDYELENRKQDIVLRKKANEAEL